ncbi:hypothetical protein SAY87_024775 [Trapa incisa]|uniref:Uncharacterized protein n=1 Tax=Trapa incisa TaxID=236973 RepID=A0AAN7JFN5_9MYRT|nr:hypothetical protein SAY87_024775 [Trapa incisa]
MIKLHLSFKGINERKVETCGVDGGLRQAALQIIEGSGKISQRAIVVNKDARVDHGCIVEHNLGFREKRGSGVLVVACGHRSPYLSSQVEEFPPQPCCSPGRIALFVLLRDRVDWIWVEA